MGPSPGLKWKWCFLLSLFHQEHHSAAVRNWCTWEQSVCSLRPSHERGPGSNTSHTHTCAHVLSLTQAHTHTRPQPNTSPHAHMCTHVLSLTQVHMHACTHILSPAQARMHTRPQPNTSPHAHMHTHPQSNTSTHASQVHTHTWPNTSSHARTYAHTSLAHKSQWHLWISETHHSANTVPLPGT